MAVYWLTFRISEKTVGGRNYETRYDALYEAIRQKSSKWWLKTTAFVVFESASTVDALAAACKAAIAPSEDLFLIRAMNAQSAIICGANDDNDIHEMMDYLKKLP